MKVDGANTTLFEPPPLPGDANAGPKDEFLRLLVAQMRHQDPLEPQDGSEFVAQLAQFANIELGVETNQRLAALEAAHASVGRASLMGLVGKQVKARADTLQLTGQGVPPLSVDVPAAATSVVVVIKDSLGKEVARVDAGARPQGTFSLPWNGNGSAGAPLAEGSYTVEVLATGPDGPIEGAHASISGLVTSMEFADDGSTLLGLGGALVSPATIESVAAADD